MRHKDWSYLKSALRIAGYTVILWNIVVAVVMLVLSEVIGIVEEIGEPR